MKTAMQRLNESFDESKATREIIGAFVDASYKNNQSYSHAAGYLQVFVAELIMQLPKAKRQQYRAQFLSSTVII